MRSGPESCSLRRVLAVHGVAACIACVSCGSESKDVARAPSGDKSAQPCAALIGSWTEVEPTDGTTIDEPDIDKVRATSPGRRLDFERGRLTILTGEERVYSRIDLEPVSDGRCVLRARDSLGRPLEIDVTFASDRLMRLHNVLEPKSPPSLFERR